MMLHATDYSAALGSIQKISLEGFSVMVFLIPQCYGANSLTGRTSTLPSRAGGIFEAT